MLQSHQKYHTVRTSNPSAVNMVLDFFIVCVKDKIHFIIRSISCSLFTVRMQNPIIFIP